MSENIHTLLEELPQTSVTTRVLGALDYLVPGQWQNVNNFEAMIKLVTGEEDQDIIQQVGERAIRLYKDPSQGYQRAVQVFRLVDNAQGVAGFVALADKFSWLQSITPKADTTQAVDAGIKFVAELTTFCLVNGIPGDSVGEFVGSLVQSGKEDSMRFAAWLALDCILPLGPDFFSKIYDGISSLSGSALESNGRFSRISAFLPGGPDDKKALVQRALEASKDKIHSFVQEKNMSRESLFGTLKQYVDLSDDKLDYVSAFLDMTTNYFEHTGIQSVTRRIVSRAYGEI